MDLQGIKLPQRVYELEGLEARYLLTRDRIKRGRKARLRSDLGNSLGKFWSVFV